MSERFVQNPVLFLQQFYGVLDQSAQQAFLAATGLSAAQIQAQATQQPPQPDSAALEGLTAQERIVELHRQQIETLPTLYQELGTFARQQEQFNKQTEQHAGWISQIYAENQALQARVAALSEFLELKLPDLDLTKPVDQAALNTYRETAVKAARETRAKTKAPPTPTTPRNGSSTRPAPGKGASLAELFAYFKEEGG